MNLNFGNSNVEKNALLFYTNLAASGISFMSSIFMFYRTSKSQRKSSSLQLITFIFLCDFLYSVSNLLSGLQNDEYYLCQIQAFMGQAFFLMSMLISSSVALMSYFTLRSLESRFDSQRFVYKAILVCGSYCFACAVLPFFFKKFVVYEKQALFCSIALPSENQSLLNQLVILMVFQGIPLIAALSITMISYYKTVASIRRTLGSVFISTRFNAYKIFWYPAVTLFVFVPHVVYNFENIFIKAPVIWIEVFHILMTNSVGFLNALAYGSLYLKSRNSQSMHNEAELLPPRNINIYQPLRSSPPRERGGQVIRQLFEEPEPSREDDRNFIPESQPSTNRSFNTIGGDSSEE